MDKRSLFRPTKIQLMMWLIYGLPALPALANPTGGSVVAGSAVMQSQGSTLTVTTSTPKSIINWQSFSIAPNEVTRFVQPSATSSVLNRVVSNEPSSLLGSLQSNGKVFLINPYGILVGPGASINVASFVASTLNVTNQDYLDGRFAFQVTPGAARVENQGSIATPEGGSVYLIAPQVANSGVIRTPGGETILAAGQTVRLMDTATPGVSVEITGSDTVATNLGKVLADAGTVGMAGALVRNTGVLDAGSVVREGGRIFLKAQTADLQGSLNAVGVARGGEVRVDADVIFQTAGIAADGGSGGVVTLEGDRILQAGAISARGSSGDGGEVRVLAGAQLVQTVAGTVNTSGKESGGSVLLRAETGQAFLSGTALATGESGGNIHVLGDKVVLSAATLDTSGTRQGGTVLVGGDFQGSNPAVQNARTVSVNHSSRIDASAEVTGNGGKVVVWADSDTSFSGSIRARGGALGGDGGLVEVSGKDRLYFSGFVDAGASAGKAGTLLLDPKNITVAASAAGGPAYLSLADPNPVAGDEYGGGQVVGLTNGNIVVASPYDDFGANDAGAVFLFNGGTGALIGALYGSNDGDLLGVTNVSGVTGGITALANGNFAVTSWRWNGSAGAVTWGSGTAGVSGTVSAANSLVGSASGDGIGSYGVFAVGSGNYVVSSADWNNARGAVTWVDGSNGRAFGEAAPGAAVSASNSLVGSLDNDNVGSSYSSSPGVTVLTNGNYVVRSVYWNGNRGAATWGGGATGIAGAISATNSLVGTSAFDNIGSAGVTALTNGHYVVASPGWNNGRGAATWMNGTTGQAIDYGTNGNQNLISAANSLIGGGANFFIGTDGVFALTNGNYVVGSSGWNGNRGAVTLGDGSAGSIGTVDGTNSIVGSSVGDRVGNSGVVALTNGNYVIRSPNWNNVRGAATWVDGTTGRAFGETGPGAVVSAANSLVGTNAGEQIGSWGVRALTNGNYVLASPEWDGTRGAVTWGNGTGGTVGVVDASNSLVGAQSGDYVGRCDGCPIIGGSAVTALPGGNYVVSSPLWANGAATQAGAVTWVNGSNGHAFGEAAPGAAVSASNSLVGTATNDRVGRNGVTVLRVNGNYVVSSTQWNSNRGAVTWGSGSSGIAGAVSSANSLVGSTAGDQVGVGGVTALTNGNYVVGSPYLDDGTTVDAGAVTWANGTTGITGAVSSANSLIGNGFDYVGSGGVVALTNGNYVVNSYQWNSSRGAATWADGTTGLIGTVSPANSLAGSAMSDEIGRDGIVALANGNFVVSSSRANSFTGRVDLGDGAGGAGGTGTVGGSTFANDQGVNYTLTSTDLQAILNAGTAVTLQANNDINITSAITSNNPSGNGGNLLLQAGRSIAVNANITTDNGNLTLSANDASATLGDRDGGAANITIASGVTVNTGSGSFSAVIGNLSTAGTFTNSGTLSTGSGSAISAIFNNAGTFNLNGGTLALANGGANGGTINLASGTQLNLTAGSFALAGGSDIAGTGLVNVDGGTLTVAAADRHIDNLKLTSGGIATGGTGNGLVVDGQFNWDHGVISGGGGFTVAGNALFANTAPGANAMLLSNQALTVNGNLAVAGQYWLDMDSAQLTVNGATAVDTSAASGLYGINSPSTVSGVSFLGGFTKTAGAQSYVVANVNAALGGTVHHQAGGDLVFDLGARTGTLTNTTFVADAGRLMKLASGNYNVAGSASFSGAGTTQIGNFDGRTPVLSVTAGNTITNSGNLNITSNATLNNTGTLINNGVLTSVPDVTLAGGGTYGGTGTLIGNLVNTGGVLAPGASPGSMTINGNYTQGPGGTLAMELGGTTQGVSYDWLNVTGTANLNGTLNVSLFGGFTPTAGSIFDLITANAISGTFSTLNLPVGYNFQTSYGSSIFGLNLLSVSTPAPTGSLIPDTLTGPSISGSQAAGGPFYGIIFPDASGIAGTTNDPTIVDGIKDLFVPVSSPFASGLTEGGSGFTSGRGTQSEGGLGYQPQARNLNFPLFFSRQSDITQRQQDSPRFIRNFGMCGPGDGS